MIKTKLKTKIKDFGVRTSLIRAADILIIGAACFLFALALTRYFVRDFVLTAIVSIIITLGMLKPIKIKGDKKQRLAFQDALDSACVDYFAFKDCE
ncbi:MAG: hypothetical protein FWD86_01210, partial [Firmicutes bacterium]|nr:hypothetical protein [Bacillota bacterium]